MNSLLLASVIKALDDRQVNQPCPRCTHTQFSVVGESEITVLQPPPQPKGLIDMVMAPTSSTRTTMPTIIVTCNNCGYVSQHAKVALNLQKPAGLAEMATGLGGGFGGRREK